MNKIDLETDGRLTFSQENPFASRTAFYLFLCFIALLIILPNVFLYSVDDVSCLANPNALEQLIYTQGGNGRYSFVVMARLFTAIGLTKADFEGLGILCTALGLVAVFDGTIKFSKASYTQLEFTLGFAIFATFGFLFDLYQFIYGAIQFGAAFLCLCLSLRAASSSLKLTRKILYCSIFAWIGLGFYQLYAYFLLCSLTAATVLGYMEFSQKSYDLRKRWKDYAAPLLSLPVSLGVYTATNKTLRSWGLYGFSDYPTRPVKLNNVMGNLPAYFQTIVDILNPASVAYGPLVSRITGFCVLLGLVLVLIRAVRGSFLQVIGVLVLLGVTVVMLPNPSNLPLWFSPSHRTICPIAIIVAAAVLGLFAYLRQVLNARTVYAFFGMVVFFQLVIYTDFLITRQNQQMLDFHLAETIVNTAYQQFHSGEPAFVKLKFGRNDNVVDNPLLLQPSSFAYGISLFATSWSGASLLSYVSNGRVQVIAAAADDCARETNQLSFIKQPGALLVCAKR